VSGVASANDQLFHLWIDERPHRAGAPNMSPVVDGQTDLESTRYRVYIIELGDEACPPDKRFRGRTNPASTSVRRRAHGGTLPATQAWLQGFEACSQARQSGSVHGCLGTTVPIPRSKRRSTPKRSPIAYGGGASPSSGGIEERTRAVAPCWSTLREAPRLLRCMRMTFLMTAV
jgi:hypothetical protein